LIFSFQFLIRKKEIQAQKTSKFLSKVVNNWC